MIVSNQDAIVAVVTIVIGLIFTFLAGGATVALIITKAMDSVANSPVIIAYLKHLADSASPALLKVLTDVDTVLDQVVPEGGKTTGDTTNPAVKG